MSDTDCLSLMWADAIKGGPKLVQFLSDADERGNWLMSLKATWDALPSASHRDMALLQLCQEIRTTRYPGLPFPAALGWLCREWGIDVSDIERAVRKMGV